MWLVTGGNGLLGAAIVRAARKAGQEVTALHQGHDAIDVDVTWQRIDLRERGAVASVIKKIRPSVVIHTAAISQPKEAELNPELATNVNVQATIEIADACGALESRLISMSTDVVFAGDRAPYDETSPTSPLHHYGRTKVEGEKAVRALCDNHVIIRTSLLLGPSPRGDRGVEELIASSLRAGKSVPLFVDEFRQPMRTTELADVVTKLTAHSFRGTLHIAGKQRLSRYDIGVTVARVLGLPEGLLTPARLAEAPNAIPPRAPDTTLAMNRLESLGLPVKMAATLEEALRTRD